MADNLVHRVIIYRADNTQIVVFDTATLSDAKNMYRILDKEWFDSTAEKRPFRLPEPAAHSMLPGLVSEIKVESMTLQQYEQLSNQYYQTMNNQGLMGAMNSHFNKP